MKYFNCLLFAALLIWVSACKKDNSATVKITPLAGNWKYNASFVSAGGPGYWAYPNNEQYQYAQFNADGKLTGNLFVGYSAYAIKDSVVVLTKTDQSLQNYSYKINNDTLIMRPAASIVCIEGCIIRLIRF